MLRDLSTVIVELHEALAGHGRAAAAGMRLRDVEITLPMDFLAVLRDGGCVLLADVARAQADAAWMETASRARFTWQMASPDEIAPPAPSGDESPAMDLGVQP
jgi:hypothetical protein